MSCSPLCMPLFISASFDTPWPFAAKCGCTMFYMVWAATNSQRQPFQPVPACPCLVSGHRVQHPRGSPLRAGSHRPLQLPAALLRPSRVPCSQAAVE